MDRTGLTMLTAAMIAGLDVGPSRARPPRNKAYYSKRRAARRAARKARRINRR